MRGGPTFHGPGHAERSGKTDLQVPRISSEENAGRVRKAQETMGEGGPAAGGYHVEYGRAGVVDKLSRQQLDYQKRVHEITMLGVEMIRPGALVQI